MTAADFSNLHLQYKAEQAEGEVPAVIEHDFPGGRMVDTILSPPPLPSGRTRASKAWTACPAFLFLQQPNGAP